MKLAIVFGSFNPPSKCDRILFDALAERADGETECVILTDDQFDAKHPMGVLEKQEVLGLMLTHPVTLRMDYGHMIEFLEAESHKYDSIEFVCDRNITPAAVKVVKKYSAVPVTVSKIDMGNADDAHWGMMVALHSGEFDLFGKYYGGDQTTMEEMFTKMKERIKCLS
jgi:hypothetical protein